MRNNSAVYVARDLWDDSDDCLSLQRIFSSRSGFIRRPKWLSFRPSQSWLTLTVELLALAWIEDVANSDTFVHDGFGQVSYMRKLKTKLSELACLVT